MSSTRILCRNNLATLQRLEPLFMKVIPLSSVHSGSKTPISSIYQQQINGSVFDIQVRNYAKSKNKSKGGGKQASVHLTDSELCEVINVENYKKELESAVENLKEDFVQQLSIRTSLGSLESIPVELEGDTYPLSEIAQIIRKTPMMVIVNATAFPQASANIKKAILESGMNLNPQQEGTTIYIPVPKVTTQYREGLAQNAKTLCDKTKLKLKEIQNKFIKKLKAKDGKVSEDLIFNAQLKIREMAQNSSSQAELMMKNKQKELLKATK